jgi:hypothetical protein
LISCDANGDNCYDSVNVTSDENSDTDISSYWGGSNTQGGANNSGANKVIGISQLTTTSAQAVGVQNSLRWIQAQISSYTDCDNWLGGDNNVTSVINTLLGQTPDVTTDSVGVGRFNDPTVNAVYGTTGTNLPTDGSALLTINLSGAFFNSNASAGTGVQGINGGSQQAKLFILLHELAHATGAAGFLSGDSSATPQGAQNQASNNALLQQKCGSFIKSVSN